MAAWCWALWHVLSLLLLLLVSPTLLAVALRNPHRHGCSLKDDSRGRIVVAGSPVCTGVRRSQIAPIGMKLMLLCIRLLAGSAEMHAIGFEAVFLQTLQGPVEP